MKVSHGVRPRERAIVSYLGSIAFSDSDTDMTRNGKPTTAAATTAPSPWKATGIPTAANAAPIGPRGEKTVRRT